MPSRYTEIDLSGIRPISIADRSSKVRKSDFASPPRPGMSVRELLDGLSHVLAAADLREIARHLAAAVHAGKPILVTMGAHVIKVGLSPVIIDLMERGIISHLALNGAGSVHDVEIALFGNTSEDVAAGITGGTFGMAREPCDFLNEAVRSGRDRGEGWGETVGRSLVEAGAPNAGLSVLAAAYRLGVPATVHVAIGTDIHHMHGTADGAAMGDTTYRDFRIFAASVAKLVNGGAILNIGSAVVLPVVIEKAIAVARNLGHPVGGFIGVNMDFLRHYRPNLNPISRANELGGKGYHLTGHHELMVPLLAAALLEELAEPLPARQD